MLIRGVTQTAFNGGIPFGRPAAKAHRTGGRGAVGPTSVEPATQKKEHRGCELKSNTAHHELASQWSPNINLFILDLNTEIWGENEPGK